MAETRSKHTWWRTAAVHFYRAFFRYLNEGLKPDTPSRQKAHFLRETAGSAQGLKAVLPANTGGVFRDHDQ